MKVASDGEAGPTSGVSRHELGDHEENDLVGNQHRHVAVLLPTSQIWTRICRAGEASAMPLIIKHPPKLPISPITYLTAYLPTLLPTHLTAYLPIYPFICLPGALRLAHPGMGIFSRVRIPYQAPSMSL